MKLGGAQLDLDEIDRRILALIQENCRLPLAKIADQVGLSPPSVMERVKKLEDGGVIMAYRALLNARLLGKDITAFIGVAIAHPDAIASFERELDAIEDVLECHRVTGSYTLMLKVKTQDMRSLEQLISRLRSIDGVVRTETTIALSTYAERIQIAVEDGAQGATRRGRKSPHLRGI